MSAYWIRKEKKPDYKFDVSLPFLLIFLNYCVRSSGNVSVNLAQQFITCKTTVMKLVHNIPQ